MLFIHNNYCHLSCDRAKWITIHGTKYKVGAIVHIGFDEDEFPQFWEIKEISIVNNNVDKALFIVNKKETLTFSEHYQAYEIVAPKQKYTKVVYSENFTCHLPYSEIKRFGSHSRYICLRYELL